MVQYAFTYIFLGLLLQVHLTGGDIDPFLAFACSFVVWGWSVVGVGVVVAVVVLIVNAKITS